MKWCAAEPGPSQTPECLTIPDLRCTVSRCTASGKRCKPSNLVLAAHRSARAMASHFRKSSPPHLMRWSMLTRSWRTLGGKRRASFVSAWMPGSSPGMTKERTERTNENVGGETPTDARLFCRGIGHGRAPQRRGAHLSAFHRGSRPKESFIARDSASGQASWDVAGHVLRIL